MVLGGTSDICWRLGSANGQGFCQYTVRSWSFGNPSKRNEVEENPIGGHKITEQKLDGWMLKLVCGLLVVIQNSSFHYKLLFLRISSLR